MKPSPVPGSHESAASNPPQTESGPVHDYRGRRPLRDRVSHRTEPISPPSDRVEKGRALAILVGAAFILRLAWFLLADSVPVSDFAEYHTLARDLLERGQFGVPERTTFRLPGYPAFLALLMLLGTSVSWLAFANVLLSTALVPLVFVLTRRLTGNAPRAPWVAALLVAFNPDFVFFAPVLASEHLLSLLVMGAALVAVSRREPRWWLAGLAGLLLGGATLTRGECLFYVPVFLVAFNLHKRSLTTTASLLLSFLVMIAPWVVRNSMVLGTPVGLSTSAGLNFYFAHNEERYGWRPLEGTAFEDLSEHEAHKQGFESGLAFLRENPVQAVIDVARGTKRLYWPSPYSVIWSLQEPEIDGVPQGFRSVQGVGGLIFFVRVFFLPLLGVALLCGFVLRQYPLRTWVVLIGLVGANWICYAVVFWGKARYRFVAEVALCILVGLVVEEAIRRRRELKERAVPVS